MVLIRGADARPSNMSMLKAPRPLIMELNTTEGVTAEGFTPRTEGNEVSAETMSGTTRDDEQLARLSREFELTASPWIGLHYKYEE